MHPRGRRHEIATILWLLSDEASFVTGAMVDAAGGSYVVWYLEAFEGAARRAAEKLPPVAGAAGA